MSWPNVLLIWRREMRDQLRDRRTLFMVAVLPVLMYPLLGTSMFQLAQFMKQSTGRVAVYGAEELSETPDLPALLADDRFAPELFFSPEDIDRLEVEVRPASEDAIERAKQAIADDEIDVAVCFPDGFGDRLQDLRELLVQARESDTMPASVVAPRPTVLSNSSREASQVAGMRTEGVVRRWRDAVVQRNLNAGNVPSAATSPFAVAQIDVASKQSRDAMLWSKLLPFVVFLWALTGAFYPAIDLCAGEKERGTLETLLASPARRTEIVGGKLLTVMTFSVFTSLLNLASLAFTAKILMGQLSGIAGGAISIAPPSTAAMAWLVVAVIPIAALFSALSLACAAYARSTKEGQYYFMPLFLAVTPLMLVPMSPGVELNLGNSLVPVMGLVLLLRAMIENQIADVFQFAAPVVLVTVTCCWLAMRWAVSQFNQESVLFRESERFDLRAAAKMMVRRRGATPSAGAAMACVAGVFLMQTVVRSLTPPPVVGESGFGYFTGVVLASQVLCILLPALFVVWLLARDWRQTLLLDQPLTAGWLLNALIAGALAVCVHPLGQRLALFIKQLYPLSEAVEAQLSGLTQLFGDAPPLWAVLLLMAALPAVCEEIAFRGVVLSGLRKSLGDAGGVLMTAVLFGATHTVLQQSLAAAPVGALIGVIALRTRSLVPCIAFHASYNALQLVSALNAEKIRDNTADWGLPEMVFTEIAPGQLGYAAPIAILGGIVAVGLLWGLRRYGRGNPQVAARLEAAAS